MLEFSQSEQTALIKKMAKRDQHIKAKHDCFIGVGYNACIDISVRAQDVFEVLNAKLQDEISANG